MDSNDIIAWSVAVAALAFAFLCIYLIKTLREAQRSLASAKSAVDEVKQTIDGLQGEIKRLTHTVTDITADVRGKLQATNPLFDAVKDVGLMLRDVTGSARDASHSFASALRRQASAIDSGETKLGWLKWAGLGMRIVNGIRSNWKEKQQKEAFEHAVNDNEQLRRDEEVFDSLNYQHQTHRRGDTVERISH